jgi:hypothetical protein
VFKKDVNWGSNENVSIQTSFKEISFKDYPSLFYWCNDNNVSHLFAYKDNKLKKVLINKNEFLLDKEISLDGLYLIDMFLKDIDKDKKLELSLLVIDNLDNKGSSKLLVYEFDDKLRQEYALNFDDSMLSIDFDGKDLIITSKTVF